MKDYTLVHLVPFDIGYSFVNYGFEKLQRKEDFIARIEENSSGTHFRNMGISSGHCMCVFELNAHIKCHLMDYGVGVFEIFRLVIDDAAHVSKKFGERSIETLFYRKKMEQHQILENINDIPELADILKFMQIVWESIDTNQRKVSASFEYKRTGLSYVLTIYHLIFDKQEYENFAKIVEKNERSNVDDYQGFDTSFDINLLMNPDILGDIEKEDQWEYVEKQRKSHRAEKCDVFSYGSIAKVAATWSAVAVIDDGKNDALEEIIEYEINLQSAWFLFDSITDNIEGSQISSLNLQRLKNIATGVSLDISNITSANMTTWKKRVNKAIYNTSDFETVEKKLMLLLDNKIATEDAHNKQRQKKYGEITEILLVVFTLLQIYEPIKDMINGTITSTDIYVGVVLVLALVLYLFLIIRKDR